MRASGCRAARCTAIALLIGVALALRAISNPVLAPKHSKFTAREYLHQSCTASFYHKLKLVATLRDKQDFSAAATTANQCKIVYRIHCREWFVADAGNPAHFRADITACETIYRNFYDAIVFDGSSANPFDALVRLGGWHSARDGWLRNTNNQLSAFGDHADMMAVAAGKDRHFWDATQRDEAAQLKMVKTVVMGMMGDDRTATMMRLISDCAVEVLRSAGINKPHAATVRKYFSVGAIGSCSPTSDFDITIKALKQTDGSRMRLTPHVAECVNQAFIERVAPSLNRDLSDHMLFSSASFYDSNVYSEDEIPAEVTETAPLEIPDGILNGIRVREMEREEGRLGMSKAADQMVWALLDPGALSMQPAGEQLIPSVEDITDVPASLGYQPFGMADALLAAVTPDPGPTLLAVRARHFAAFVKGLRKRTDECRAIADSVEAPVKHATSKALAKTGFRAKLGAGRITDAEYKVLARNIAYTELSKLTDALGAYKDELSAEKIPNPQALRAAVGGYYNLRSLSMQYASEAGRTAGLLWHVLPVLQMRHETLQPGVRLMLPAYVENFQNAIHKTKHLLLPAGRPEQTVKCTAGRRKLINDVLAAGGKYLFRYTDAFVRMDGGLRKAEDIPPDAAVCDEVAREDGGGARGAASELLEGHTGGGHHFRSLRASTQQVLGASGQAAVAAVTEQSQALDVALVTIKAASLGRSARAILKAYIAARTDVGAQVPLHATAEADTELGSVAVADTLSAMAAEGSASDAADGSLGVDAEVGSNYTMSHIVPTSELDLLHYLCGRKISQDNRDADVQPTRAPHRGIAACTARRTLNTDPELDGDKVLAAYYAAAGGDVRAIAATLKQTEDRVGGINKAYARLGRAFEDLRKADNDAIVATLLDVNDPSKPSLAFSAKNDAPLWNQLRDAGRLTVAGALSRLLGEAQCWADDGSIKASCAPSIAQAGCTFPVLHLGDASTRKRLMARAAKEPAMAALLSVVDAAGHLDWAALQKHVSAQVRFHLPTL